MLFALYPFVWISQKITRSLKKEKEKSVFSRTDFAALAEEGLKTGVIDQSESQIISNLLQLQQLVVSDIMTPRSVMSLANKELTTEQYFEERKPLVFSRVPIFSEKPDHLIGFVLKDQILEALAAGEKDKKLSDLSLDLLFVEDKKPVLEVMNLLLKQNVQFAVVKDNYGSIAGLVTMEDIFETLLGMEIMDESDTIEDMQKHARELWQKRYERIQK